MDIWQIKQVKLGDLIPNAKNPRKISQEKLAALQDKIERLGFHNPIKTDENMQVLGGNQRLKALLKIAGKDLIVPVMVPNRPLTEEEKQEIIITDNIADGDWDWEKLSKEWDKELTASWGLDWLDCDYDDGQDTEQNEIIEDEVPEEVETRCKRGDIWQLGKHRLMCGDSTNRDEIKHLINGKQCHMIFTDPPYNVNYGNTMKNKIRGTERTIMNDNLGGSFAQFLTDACKNIVEFCNGAIYICMSSSELHTLYSSFVEAGGKWSTFIIWAKNTFTLGRSDYQRQYEPILYGWPKDKKHYWCGDRNQSDVWEYNKPQKNDLHPTMKPIELCVRAIKNSSKKGQICGDFFGGSGSTLIACEQLDRICYMMELDEHYCDVIIQRWENLTGQKAKLLS